MLPENNDRLDYVLDEDVERNLSDGMGMPDSVKRKQRHASGRLDKIDVRRGRRSRLA
jgi:hypothetical protein